MKQYSFPSSLIYSFGSMPFYRNVYLHWNGTGFLHAFYCTFIVCVLSYLFISTQISSMKEEKNIEHLFQTITSTIADKDDFEAEEQLSRLLKILAQIPDMRIENNSLVSDEKMPININDPYSLRYLITINTNDGATITDNDESRLFFFKNHLTLKREGSKNATIPYESLHGSYINSLNLFFHYAAQLPEIQIKDDIATIDRPSPYVIYKKDGINIPFIVFDTEADIPSDNPLYKNAAAIVTQSQLFLKSKMTNEQETEWFSFPYTEISNENLYNNFLHAVPLLANYTTQVFLPQNALQFFIIWLFLVIACALLLSLATGFFAKSLLDKSINYGDILRLSSIAITPIILLSPLFYLGKFFYPSLFLSPTASCILLCLLYSLFAVASLRTSHLHSIPPVQ